MPTLDALSEHFARYVGPTVTVLHELVSELVHIDVHIIAPSASSPTYLLYTTGMSARPMKVPPGCPDPARAELMLRLPASWQLGEKDERWHWPIRWLKTLARLPHRYDTWLGFGHTVPNGEEARPFAPSTKLGCMVVVPPMTLPEEAHVADTPDGPLRFWAVVALHPDEMHLKMKHGVEALLPRFESAGVTELVDDARPSVLAAPTH